jgi:hypothetical protein
MSQDGSPGSNSTPGHDGWQWQRSQPPASPPPRKDDGDKEPSEPAPSGSPVGAPGGAPAMPPPETPSTEEPDEEEAPSQAARALAGVDSA